MSAMDVPRMPLLPARPPRWLRGRSPLRRTIPAAAHDTRGPSAPCGELPDADPLIMSIGVSNLHHQRRRDHPVPGSAVAGALRPARSRTDDDAVLSEVAT